MPTLSGQPKTNTPTILQFIMLIAACWIWAFFWDLTNFVVGKFSNVNYIGHCLPRLPPIPKLTSLDFSFLTGMNHLHFPHPPLTNGLNEVTLYDDVDNIDTIYIKMKLLIE